MMDQQQQLIDWISHDKNFTEIFNILDRYHLTEATLCAGSIRELVWNKLENKPSSILRNNLDIYYNDPGESYEHYLTIQSTLNQRHSKYLWDLRRFTRIRRKLLDNCSLWVGWFVHWNDHHYRSNWWTCLQTPDRTQKMADEFSKFEIRLTCRWTIIKYALVHIFIFL